MTIVAGKAIIMKSTLNVRAAENEEDHMEEVIPKGHPEIEEDPIHAKEKKK